MPIKTTAPSPLFSPRWQVLRRPGWLVAGQIWVFGIRRLLAPSPLSSRWWPAWGRAGSGGFMADTPSSSLVAGGSWAGAASHGAQPGARQREGLQRAAPPGRRRRGAVRLQPAPAVRAVVDAGRRVPAPEVVDTRRLTFKSDVYSLGVLLLELLTGKSPSHASLEGDGTLDLPRWVQSVVREEWTAEVFDVELVRLGASAEEEMVALLQVAMACVATVPDARPDAPDVVRMIEEIGSGHGGRTTTEESEGVRGTSEEERSRLPLGVKGRRQSSPLSDSGGQAGAAVVLL
ncbi:hypothetical protein BDA96_01G487800 [Sorghum bicolor]|uniref:Serine-threonine/tyrosine-protein kinase catalytic domain-containing protein n=1 Tax=Sorghum bicolor TaxID=4558 RepID=A0A921V288_SORBI|nr:hypothetical protein BDA96_01G487800 [Sorghum bicolor]